MVSDAAATDETMALLADVLATDVGCAGVAVVAVQPDGSARIAAGHGLPDSVRSMPLDPDAMGGELGRHILAAGERWSVEVTRPLVAAGNLFGAVVMLFGEGGGPSPGRLRLAEGLVDLTAMALAWAAQRDQLERSYAELRASQDTLMRNEKLRALGEMAAGVSHDLKNIMNPVSLHLQLAEEALRDGDVEEARNSVRQMQQIVVRGLQTIDRLRTYGRQDTAIEAEPVDLDRLAREAAAIARPRMSSGRGRRIIPIVEELTGPPPVMVASGDVLSALVNLIVNAIDALSPTKQRGRITLRSGVVDGGSFVEVADDGPGIPPEVERRLFEPFFTTKGEEGTGLGLAMVYATARHHGGKVTLDTAPGRGATFRLWFPQLAARTRPEPAPPPAPAACSTERTRRAPPGS
jgi:signal transduction histidine kinase